jgi:hypothetical protein
MYVKKFVVPAAVSRPERSDRVSEEASFHLLVRSTAYAPEPHITPAT